MVNNSKFQITVGVSPLDGTLSIRNELDLLKTALIYADKVNLCSIKTAFFMPVLKLNEIQQIEFLEEFIEGTSENTLVLKECKKFYQYLSKKRGHLTKEETMLKFHFQKVLNVISKSILKTAENEGYSQLIPLLKKSLLEINFYSSAPAKLELEKALYEYVDYISNELKNNAYLLVDTETGSALSSIMQKGVFSAPETAIAKARHINLFSNLMQRLPCFEYATLDEAIDIKKELSKQLIRFRATMIKISSAIKSQPWDKEFEYDCEKTYYSEIQPIVLDIEDACNSNTYLKKLFGKTIDSAPYTTGATVLSASLGAFISPMSNLVDICTTVAGSTSIIALKAAKEWYQEKNKNESNQLFFYYKAGKIIQNKYRKN
ncbi:MAG: hypothetical protein E6713_13375 [Sporomusaceae bacterium]|nr:hypothetical protein [Sporomusaceae bacterium]